MNVTSCCAGRRRSKRLSLAAVLMVALGLGGVVHAAEFDEKLKTPKMKSAADFKSQAQSFATKYREVRAANPAQLVTDASLAKQQFDLKWQLERAINERRPPGDLETLGFQELDNGGYSIDTRKYPEWRAQGDNIATIFGSNLGDGFYEELLQRGFRPRRCGGSHGVHSHSRCEEGDSRGHRTDCAELSTGGAEVRRGWHAGSGRAGRFLLVSEHEWL
jgi:hypothetical protein